MITKALVLNLTEPAGRTFVQRRTREMLAEGKRPTEIRDHWAGMAVSNMAYGGQYNAHYLWGAMVADRLWGYQLNQGPSAR